MRRLLLLAYLALPALANASPPSEGSKSPATPWAYRAPRQTALPQLRHPERAANPIDFFLLARLEAASLSLSPAADPLTELRRVTFDLTGLLPTLAEQEAYLADSAPDRYSRLVERLLASPQYGERWAQHWLDLVRYAETDGFKADDYRPQAHGYRDYVIRSLNADLPYDRFVRQQIAGDELEAGNPEALRATGFNRLYPDENNAANLEQRRQEILDDITDVTGSVFLGLTLGCARCHDHKFDPLSHNEYYQFQAFYAALLPRDDVPTADTEARRRHVEATTRWEEASRAIRDAIEALVGEERRKARETTLGRFRTEIQAAVRTPEAKRTPYQQQIAVMAEKQLVAAEKAVAGKLPAERKKQLEELERRLADLPAKRPEAMATAMVMTDVGRSAPPTHRLGGGDWRRPRREVEPGFPKVLGSTAPDTAIDPSLASTGRRAALARWLTQPDHPLTARVIANRLWQHHFGVGIVETPNDFGLQGIAPTHPELLDWLAVDLVEHGWSLKRLHRLMVTSAAYRQASRVAPSTPAHRAALTADRENRLLWHARRRRLEGEAIRDAVLALSGELNRQMYGVSARPALPAGLSSYAWKPDARSEDQHRRSVYVFVKRNLRYPLFDAFDLPDLHNSCACRSRTTTAPQSLLLLNGEFTLERAAKWAARLPREVPLLVGQAYREAWGRTPTDRETDAGIGFVEAQAAVRRSRGEADEAARVAAVADFCHALLNSNAYLYVD